MNVPHLLSGVRLYGLGAGLGGPLGGWMNDALGWCVHANNVPTIFSINYFSRRSAFLLQVSIGDDIKIAKINAVIKTPVLTFSFILVALKVNVKLPYELQHESTSDKLRRIDFLGSLTLVGTVGCLLLGFSLKSTEEMSWSHPLIWGLLAASSVWGFLFVLVESFWAPYPVMPLCLITQRTPLAVSLSNLVTSMSAFSMVRTFIFMGPTPS